MRTSRTIDHLHNYGAGTRFGASRARIGRDECVSHLSFRFSSALECRSAITGVFLAVSIEAGLHSSLIVFHGHVSSGSAGYLPFARLTDRTFASPTTRSYALSTSSLRKNFALDLMLVPKSLWTLPSPLLPKASLFLKAGAVPLVFSFRPHVSQGRVRST